MWGDIPGQVRAALGAVAFLASLSVGSAAVAAEPGSAEETIENFNSAILEAMTLPKGQGIFARYKILHEAVGEAFDMKVLARATINRVHWRTWSPDQQSGYITTLRRYQSAVLADRFETGSNISFVIDRTIDAPRGTKVVETRILRPAQGRDDIGLDYRLVKRTDRWRIIDVYLNSRISEVAMRRSEYSQVVRDEGYNALIAALEKQTRTVLGPAYKPVKPASAANTN
jgi:phospholipid transport system substrate-binding protein